MAMLDEGTRHGYTEYSALKAVCWFGYIKGDICYHWRIGGSVVPRLLSPNVR